MSPPVTSPFPLADLGRHADAIAEMQALVAESAARGDREDEALVLRALANVHVARGAPAEALPLIERARSLRVGLDDREFEAAKLDFSLGRARWAAGQDRRAARRLVEETAAKLRAAGPDAAATLAELEKWLADPRAK